jgi:hypothetical protein
MTIHKAAVAAYRVYVKTGKNGAESFKLFGALSTLISETFV